jgi:hypothetical protein
VSQSETSRPGLAALGNIYLRIGNSLDVITDEREWDILIGESKNLLRFVKRQSSDTVDTASLALARVIHASNYLGEKAAMRVSSSTQSEKARAGKKRKTDRRWTHIRCAIVRTCRQQKLTMLASASFAESIRSDVMDAAKKYGLNDISSGLSARSIERHIAALIKDRRLLNATLEECELQELL